MHLLKKYTPNHKALDTHLKFSMKRVLLLSFIKSLIVHKVAVQVFWVDVRLFSTSPPTHLYHILQDMTLVQCWQLFSDAKACLKSRQMLCADCTSHLFSLLICAHCALKRKKSWRYCLCASFKFSPLIVTSNLCSRVHSIPTVEQYYSDSSLSQHHQ